MNQLEEDVIKATYCGIQESLKCHQCHSPTTPRLHEYDIGTGLLASFVAEPAHEAQNELREIISMVFHLVRNINIAPSCRYCVVVGR